uniref:Uncharacterized protein n=1 Tax=Magallana gigas TaxID=29159 RepID=K1RMF1_MAGGI
MTDYELEFPAKPKGELQKSNDEKFMKFLKTQGKETNDPKTNVKGGTEEGLYEMLQEYMIENESLRTENSEMHQAKDKVKREQQLMYRENERLTKGPPPPRQGGNKPPPNNQWKGTPPQRPINNRPPPDQYIPGPSPQAGRGKQSTPPGGPKRPPHRLADPIARTANIPPEYIQNGIGGYPDDGYMSPRGRPSPLHNGPIRQVYFKIYAPGDSHNSPLVISHQLATMIVAGLPKSPLQVTFPSFITYFLLI